MALSGVFRRRRDPIMIVRGGVREDEGSAPLVDGRGRELTDGNRAMLVDASTSNVNLRFVAEGASDTPKIWKQ